MTRDNVAVEDPQVIVTNLHRRYTGVTATIEALLPVQARGLRLWLVGQSLDCAEGFSLIQALKVSARPPTDRPFRIWHLRRNNEMQAALFARDVLRLPIRIVFTSAARRRHSWWPRRLIERMDAVVATSTDAAVFVPHVAAVISHGVDVDRFTPPADKATAWLASGLPGRYGIGIAGRVRPQKGTDLFIEAMLELLPHHPDFTAVVIGECKEREKAWQEQLLGRIAAAGLSERILFLGHVSSDERIEWYRRLLVVVAPARQEQFGLTPLEGMACGAAVVASRTGAFEDLIEPDLNGSLVPTGDASALGEALKPLLGDPDRALQMGAAGRRRAVERFNIQREADGLVGVYDRVWSGETFCSGTGSAW